MVAVRNVLPGWAVRLLVATLLRRRCWPRSTAGSAPAAASRGRPLGGLGRRGGGPALAAWLWLRMLGLTGAIAVPASPVVPDAYRLGGRARGARLAAIVAALGWFGVRPLMVAGSPGRQRRGGRAGCRHGHRGHVAAPVVWLVNPFAAALLHRPRTCGCWRRPPIPPARRVGRCRSPGRRRWCRRALPARARPQPGSLGWPVALATADGHISLGALWRRGSGAWRGCSRAAHAPQGRPPPSPSGCAPAGPPATPGPARSAGRSRRCGERRAPLALDGADRGRRAAARGRGRDAAVAGAALGVYGRVQQGKLEDGWRRWSAAGGRRGPAGARAARPEPADGVLGPRVEAPQGPRRPARADPDARDRGLGGGRGGDGRRRPAPGRATTRPRRCPASAGRSASPATARPTAPRSTTSTSSSPATGSS